MSRPRPSEFVQDQINCMLQHVVCSAHVRTTHLKIGHHEVGQGEAIFELGNEKTQAGQVAASKRNRSDLPQLCSPHHTPRHLRALGHSKSTPIQLTVRVRALGMAAKYPARVSSSCTLGCSPWRHGTTRSRALVGQSTSKEARKGHLLPASKHAAFEGTSQPH